jgi:hypothetical protein
MNFTPEQLEKLCALLRDLREHLRKSSSPVAPVRSMEHSMMKEKLMRECKELGLNLESDD